MSASRRVIRVTQPTPVGASGESPLRLGRAPVLRRLLGDAGGLIGLAIITLFVIVAVLAPFLTAETPRQQDLSRRLAPPSWRAPLGFDELGRNEGVLIIWGSRTSLTIAVASVLASVGAGVPLGLVGGFYRGVADDVIMRIVDVMLAFPGVLLALVVIAVLGSGLTSLILAVTVYSVPTYVRLVRAATLQIMPRQFIEAARATGAGSVRIMRLHVLPNILGPIIVQGSLSMGTVILTAGAMSFLGLGVQPPTVEWGAMISTGRLYVRNAPHAVVAPGLAIVLVVLGFNLLGDALRDTLDPTSRLVSASRKAGG